MMKSLMSVACLCWLLSPGSALAEGQALSANGGSSGMVPARVGSGNQLPDVKTPYAPPRTSAPSSAGARLPVNGAADRPNEQTD